MTVLRERADEDVALLNAALKASKAFKKIRNATPDTVYRMLKKDYGGVDDAYLKKLAGLKERRFSEELRGKEALNAAMAILVAHEKELGKFVIRTELWVSDSDKGLVLASNPLKMPCPPAILRKLGAEWKKAGGYVIDWEVGSDVVLFATSPRSLSEARRKALAEAERTKAVVFDPLYKKYSAAHSAFLAGLMKRKIKQPLNYRLDFDPKKDRQWASRLEKLGWGKKDIDTELRFNAIEREINLMGDYDTESPQQIKKVEDMLKKVYERRVRETALPKYRGVRCIPSAKMPKDAWYIIRYGNRYDVMDNAVRGPAGHVAICRDSVDAVELCYKRTGNHPIYFYLGSNGYYPVPKGLKFNDLNDMMTDLEMHRWDESTVREAAFTLKNKKGKTITMETWRDAVEKYIADQGILDKKELQSALTHFKFTPKETAELVMKADKVRKGLAQKYEGAMKC